MKLTINPARTLCVRDPMIYGQFLEHFDRQIYGGVFMPGHPLSDKDGFREDVLDALRGIMTPVIRWPGGCFVSAYHWKHGVGQRVPDYDKAWRVEDSNAFGTDEFVLMCKKLGCEPYICTNAGTGTAEEMSDWVEYTNLPTQGQWARLRRAGGHDAPFNVKYWSIGNENYGSGEMGAKTSEEWARLVTESAKMMKRVDPSIELSTAALPDVSWNIHFLQQAGRYLSWVSLHGYFDGLFVHNNPASYDQCMAQTATLTYNLNKIRGLLMAFGLDKQIRIAYDEWNLRSWHHPDVDTAPIGTDEFIRARAKADINSTYTMADAVFNGCFLNMLLRNADIVGMAAYSPAVNTRGSIYVHDKGIVKRTTWHVFYLYTHLMGDQVLDSWADGVPVATKVTKYDETYDVEMIDSVATRFSQSGDIAVSLVNKEPEKAHEVEINLPAGYRLDRMTTLRGHDKDDYNDVDRDAVLPEDTTGDARAAGATLKITLSPHSVNIVTLKAEK